jgi:hypothetical protein
MMLIGEIFWVSVVRACTNLLAEIQEDDAYSADIDFIDWETMSENDELPELDLMGPSSLGVVEEKAGMFSVSFSVGGSTYGDDKNLFRQRNLMARILERFRVLKNIPLLHPSTGAEVGFLKIVNGTTLSPMGGSNLRPLQFVHVQAEVQLEA